MTYKIDKKIADNLMKEEGEVRGVVLKTDESFILFKGGPKKVLEVENKLKELGYPLDYKKINSMGFYPLGLRILSLLVIIQIFEMGNKEIKEMGAMAPKMSLIIKFFARYFLSVEKAFNQAAQIWLKHYTIGQLVPVEFDEKKKFIILKLENFKIHSIMYAYLSGYFSQIVEFVVNSKAKLEKNDGSLNNKESYIFKIKW